MLNGLDTIVNRKSKTFTIVLLPKNKLFFFFSPADKKIVNIFNLTMFRHEFKVELKH